MNMEDRELDRQVKQAFDSLTPDIFDSVLSDCRRQTGKVVSMKPRQKRKLLRRAAGIAAALLLMVGGVSAAGLWRLENTAVASVSLDVNPSVEIKVNEKEKVVSVTALNEDGQQVIADMDFEGSSLEVTVNALIGSMLRQGYLSVTANSVLVSVESADSEQAAALEQRLRAEIGSLLESGGVSGAVLSQQVNADEELRALAEEYGLSLGKAQLIRDITAQDSQYRFADLAGLTINQLNLLSNDLALSNVQRSGQASEAGYIGSVEALNAALADAGISGENISAFFSRMGWEDSRMVYDLAFDDGENSYQYMVEALTGQIVSSVKELSTILEQHAGEAGQIAQEQTGSMADLVQEQSQSLEEWLSSASGDWAEWIKTHDEEIERWAEESGGQWEVWAEQYGNDWEAWARDHAAEIESWARAQGRVWENYGELWESWAESFFG